MGECLGWHISIRTRVEVCIRKKFSCECLRKYVYFFVCSDENFVRTPTPENFHIDVCKYENSQVRVFEQNFHAVGQEGTRTFSYFFPDTEEVCVFLACSHENYMRTPA